MDFNTVKIGAQIGYDTALPMLPFVLATRASESGWKDLGKGNPAGVIKIIAASTAYAYLSDEFSLLKLFVGREATFVAGATLIATTGLVSAAVSSIFSFGQSVYIQQEAK